MKAICLILCFLFLLPTTGPAASETELSENSRSRIQSQVREMVDAQVPAEAARQMLEAMHRHRFRQQSIEQAMQTVADCARSGLPTDPVVSKAMEGLAKRASEQRIVAAMKTVRNRYAQASQTAQALSNTPKGRQALMGPIADSLAAGMTPEDMEKVANRIQTRAFGTPNNNTNHQELAMAALSATRTLSRLGLPSPNVSGIVCEALENQYTEKEMKTLRDRIAKQIQRTSPQAVAAQYAGAIGNGASNGQGNAGSGSGNGSGAGGSGGGTGGNGGGSGGGGNGAGGGGSGNGK